MRKLAVKTETRASFALKQGGKKSVNLDFLGKTDMITLYHTMGKYYSQKGLKNDDS